MHTEAAMFTVEGTVTSPDRAGVGGLRVEILDRNVGLDIPLAEAVTDERGRYEVRFAAPSLDERRKTRPDLQARVHAGGALLAASEVHYNATGQETLDVVLPAGSAALPSEHESLIHAMAAHYDGPLGSLEESDQRQDVTYLANKTGWDARAVALAALADRFSRDPTIGPEPAPSPPIHPALYYALFRAGLPASADTLYQADAEEVGRVWEHAIAAGVIPRALENELPDALRAFQRLGAAHAQDARALAGTSTLGEMLQVTLGEDAERRQRFADLYTRHRGDPPRLWDAVRESFGEDTEKRLRLDGQLGYLTRNNAPLIRRLHEVEGQAPLVSTLDLAQRGYHRAEKWSALLDGAVPDAIPGATPEEKRAHYAELMASEVRLSFPTAVVARMVRTGELPLTAGADVRDGVHRFLTEHQGKFEIGVHPIDRYLAQNRLGAEVAAPVKEQIKRLQRVYQITPTDQAMTALLTRKLDSAYSIVRYDQEEFVRTFKEDLGGDTNARLVHEKSQQVHNAVLNIAAAYLTARGAPALGADTHAMIVRPDAAPAADNAGDVLAYPTLERLFGSMDYCACERCRSILSPAAYLVDLLLFVDRPVNDIENPQAVLLERRPDLQHLPLTCENTNTPLPYIDVVNETLEYFVAAGLSIAGYTGHDTGDRATREELLANPQFVNETAYTTLQAELFPPPLPFHRPLEAARRHFERLEIPLHAAMEALRRDDAVERTSAASPGWRDILMERLGLSRAEYALLTDRTKTLQQLYGFAPATPDADVLAALGEVKGFARRIGVTYQEVIDILQTRFINPSSALISRLERLRIPFATLEALKKGTLSDAAFDALLPPGLDPAPYGDDIKAWVKDDANYARIMGLITISDPKGSGDLCSFDDLELRYADPDTTHNSLHAIDHVRLLRFIRLWKKLGWTIQETDQAITALYPAAELPTGADDAANLQRLDKGFLVLLPRLGVVRGMLDRLKLSPKRDLAGLLACWSPIGVHGDRSLYRAMFQSPAFLKQYPAFADDSHGNVLQDPTQKLLAHAEALRAAFNLAGDELAAIVSALGFDAGTPLTLATLSAVHRRGWLARKLRLSVRELLLLIRFTGLDPFAAPDPPSPPMVRLVDLVEALRAAALKPVQALYLLWNQDISGKSAPDERDITELARTLRADFASIAGELALATDLTGKEPRKRQQALTRVSAEARADRAFAIAILDDAAVLHAAGDITRPALDDLTALEAPGPSAGDGILVDRLRSVYLRFLKSSALASGLRMTAREIAHFAARAGFTIGGQGWLNALPVSGSPDAPTSQALGAVLTALLDFARIKAALSPDDERLLEVLQDPAATLPNGDSLLTTLTGWESASLGALLARFGKTPADLADLDTFRRVHDAYALVTRSGMPASALLAAATNEPDASTLRAMQSALRARYDEAAWLGVLAPINDAMRALQRDALVAYILEKLGESPATRHIDTADKLFEYFLMDVQMDPCMQTSRVRHALSSVQLFIERCLMNLEPRVAPSSIKVEPWEWMKRYRVWEANRKIFLWPENWLEPELRDDQSPFFKETMSELLQSDITEDTAATALLGYLSKLEEVAKLEPCGIHYVENDPGVADDIAHVVARTAGAHRKYYYRRREHGYWTPWETIKVDIEDNPVLPVVWKGRLLLFWLRILKQAPLDAPQKPGSGDVPLTSLKTSDIKTNTTNVTVQAVLCWSEYHNGKWQPARTSDVDRPTTLGQFNPGGSSAFDRSKLLLGVSEESGALRVGIFGEGGSSFLLYNTHSLPARREDLLLRPWGAAPLPLFFGKSRSLDTSSETLTITYSLGLTFIFDETLKRAVLKSSIHDRTVAPRHRLQNVWDAPFFYEDGRHVFYVTTTEKTVLVPSFSGYGAFVSPEILTIPPMLLERAPRLRRPFDVGPILTGVNPGVVDPSPIERFVNEGTPIRIAIGTTAVVPYGDREIGPAGAAAMRRPNEG